MNYDELYNTECRYNIQQIDVEPLKTYFLKKQGWVYVAKSLDNKFLKIGRTKKNPHERAKSLSSTGVLNDYKIIFSLKFFNQFWAEKSIHKALKKYNVNKEFYSVDENTSFEIIYKMSELEYYLLNRFINTEIIKDDLDLIPYSLQN